MIVFSKQDFHKQKLLILALFLFQGASGAAAVFVSGGEASSEQ